MDGQNWRRLKWIEILLGFLKTVQPINNFSEFISAVCNFKINAQEYAFVCLECLILSFTCNFFAYFQFHSDWGWVIGKIKQNEVDCRDTAPLILRTNRKLNNLWYPLSGSKSLSLPPVLKYRRRSQIVQIKFE